MNLHDPKNATSCATACPGAALDRALLAGGRTGTRLGQAVLLGALFMGVILLGGCQQRMAAQPSYKPLEPSEFFADGRSARPLVPGTIPRGHLRTDTAYYTGRRPGTSEERIKAAAKQAKESPAAQTKAAEAVENENFVTEFPFPITREVIEHGQHRYMIYCTVCHDPLGTGQGIVVDRGYTRPPSYHIPRLRKAPVGRLYAVISEGYGSMPSYGHLIPPRDRWAIVAYLRALQESQHFPEKEVTAGMKEQWAQQDQAGRAEEESP